MTDEQKFRLLEWMKAVTMKLEEQSDWPSEMAVIRTDLIRFEQSLQSEEKKPE